LDGKDIFLVFLNPFSLLLVSNISINLDREHLKVQILIHEVTERKRRHVGVQEVQKYISFMHWNVHQMLSLFCVGWMGVPSLSFCSPYLSIPLILSHSLSYSLSHSLSFPLVWLSNKFTPTTNTSRAPNLTLF